MSSNEIAISVQNLSKCYQIYDAPHDRLKQFVLPRLQHLTGKAPKQYFREFWALHDVSFEIKKGETVGIIGRNGSGKSTLLQLICGTLSPTSGAITVNGKVAALLELGAGFNSEFTGRENVYMTAALYGLTHAEIDARFEQIIAFADIGQFVEQAVKTYSSGMYVRLAFAVIAHVDADILVIDEALSVGDVFFVQKCMRFLRKFMENGTVLFVSHDTGAVTSLCQSAVWLQNGQVKYQGSPKSAAEQYLAALYESQQGQSPTPPTHSNTEALPNASQPITTETRDMRRDFINATNLRNDIELFNFSMDAAGFGVGGATITAAQLLDAHGNRLNWVVGGEDVQLVICCSVTTSLVNPIIGFFIKDRLGQTLFGDNTFITYSENPLHAAPEETIEAKFEFKMPILPIGDYSLTVAIASGTQQEHIQHHWIHDALVFKSHSSSTCTGLIGIPMTHISMSTK
ncbi:ABC transporter ATP-binding protein [Alcaligenaceae bacterium]|nr:ABC transporter ATP-binding protein [Alcaligenaceae bacterium]